MKNKHSKVPTPNADRIKAISKEEVHGNRILENKYPRKMISVVRVCQSKRESCCTLQ